MAMLFMDGCDTYDTTKHYAITKRYNANGYYSTEFGGTTISATGSNFSTPCIVNGASTSYIRAVKLNRASHSSNEVFLGFWIKISGKPLSASKILQLSETRDHITTTASNDLTCSVWVNVTTGYVSIRQWYDTNTSVDYTGTIDICDNTWHWFEARLQWDQSTGDVETYIDGSADITVNLADTISATSPPTFTGWRFACFAGASGSGLTTSWDDVIIYDVESSPTGTPTSGDFPLGESKIETLTPSGTGTNSDFSTWGVSGANYTAVDEGKFNWAHYDIVFSGTANDIDTYAFTNLSNTPNEIHTLCIDVYARKTGPTAYLQGVAYSSSTTGTTASKQLDTYGYKVYQTEMPYDPNTTALWTGSGVDAAEFGFKYTTS